MSAARTLTGGCHCRSLSYELQWPESEGEIPARRCTCSYCTRFNGTWTSHPRGRLTLFSLPGTDPIRYRFGTGTADFLSCQKCGITVAAVSGGDSALKAVVNIRSLDAVDSLAFQESDSNFDNENLAERGARRLERWIGTVIFAHK